VRVVAVAVLLTDGAVELLDDVFDAVLLGRRLPRRLLLRESWATGGELGKDGIIL